MNLADLWEQQVLIGEFDRDAVTPLLHPLIPEFEKQEPIDLGPISRICQAPRPHQCYICAKMTDTMFLDKTPMCMRCATFLSQGLY